MICTSRRMFLVLMSWALAVHAAPPDAGYRLVWSDEFNGASLDTTKWGYRALGPRKGGVNVREAVSVKDGMLLIVTSKADSVYHTGMIATQQTYQTAFGYFETRVRLQKSIGHWSAFWLQSPTVTTVGPTELYGTEIDIYEYLRIEPQEMKFNLHWNGYGADHKSAGSTMNVPGLDTGFHTVGLEWTPERYRFYVDGVLGWETDTALSHVNEYIILSCEVGPWAGSIAEAALPDTCFFDYVRVYKQATHTNRRGGRSARAIGGGKACSIQGRSIDAAIRPAILHFPRP